jgi:hypothetical protein
MKKHYLTFLFLFASISLFSQVQPNQFISLLKLKAYINFIPEELSKVGYHEVIIREGDNFKCIFFLNKINDEGIRLYFDSDKNLEAIWLFFNSEKSLKMYKDFMTKNKFYQKTGSSLYPELNSRLWQKIKGKDMVVGFFEENEIKKAYKPCDSKVKTVINYKYQLGFNARPIYLGGQ